MELKTPKARAVFCDFDGTISQQENFAITMQHFTPALCDKLLPQMYALQLTPRQVVRQILESIPSRKYPELLDFVRQMPVRQGLPELLDYLDSKNVPFIVVSSGIRGMVEAVLGPFVSRVSAIHTAEADTSGEYLQISSEFEDETELVSKVDVMSRYPVSEPVAIGNSTTDLNMALQASIVFARDRLAQYLQERQHNYILWDNFLEVRDFLQTHWQ